MRIKAICKWLWSLPEWARYASLFMAMAFTLHAGFFWAGKNAVFEGDPLMQNFPDRHLLAHAYRTFQLPLWNPYEFIGIPLLGTMQQGPLYPVNILLYSALQPLTAFNIGFIVTYAIAASGMFMFLRMLDLERPAAFLGAILFGFSGFVFQSWHIMITAAAAWLPWMLYFLERLRRGGGMRPAAALGIAVATQVFAGNFQMCVYSYMVLLAYGLFGLCSMDGWEGRLRFMAFSIVGMLSGLLMASPQILASYELSSHSFLGAKNELIGYEYYSRGHFNLPELPSMFFPGFFGSWGYVEHEPARLPPTVIVFGLVTLLAAWKTEKQVTFWATVALVSFLLALGPGTPLHALMYKVPIYNNFRMTGRHMMEFEFAISVLSAFGVQNLLGKGRRRQVVLHICVSAFIVVMAYGSVAMLSRMDIGAVVTALQQMKFREPARLYGALSLGNPALLGSAVYFGAVSAILAVSMRAGSGRVTAYLFVGAVAFMVMWPYRAYVTGQSKSAQKDLNNLCLEEQYAPVINREDFDHYRLVNAFPPDEIGLGTFFNPMANLTCRKGSLTAFNPLSINAYNEMTDLGLSGYYSLSWDKLLRNNVILSMLGGRFVTVSKRVGLNNFKPVQNRRQEGQGLDSITAAEGPGEVRRLDVGVPSWSLRGGVRVLKEGTYEMLAQSRGEAAELSGNLVVEDGTYEACISVSGSSGAGNLQIYLYEPPLYNQIEWLFVHSELVSAVPEEFCGVVNLFRKGKNPYLMSISSSSSLPLSVSNPVIRKIEPYPMWLNARAANTVYERLHETDKVTIYENHNALPRAWFVREAIGVQSALAVKNQLYDLSLDPASTALVSPASAKALQGLDFAGGSAVVTSQKLNSLTLSVSSEGSGFLVVADQYYPGWNAKVDAGEVDIHRVNSILRGIAVPAGSHTVTFTYRPVLIMVALALSAIIFAVCLTIFVFKRGGN